MPGVWDTLDELAHDLDLGLFDEFADGVIYCGISGT